MSWHWVFIVTGGIGIIWSFIWIKVYQPPRRSKGVNQAELEYIRDGGGLVDGDAPVEKKRVCRSPAPTGNWFFIVNYWAFI